MESESQELETLPLKKKVPQSWAPTLIREHLPQLWTSFKRFNYCNKLHPDSKTRSSEWKLSITN